MFFTLLAGTVMVTIGLILFMLGIKIGLLPLGETVGAEIPKWGSAVIVIAIAFILGFAVTVAEPDVRILADQVEFVSQGDISKSILIFMVALGVGIFVGLAMLRIILGIPLAYLLGAGYVLFYYYLL